MANQDPRTLKQRGQKRPDAPSISQCVYVGFTNTSQSTFDRKADEMKVFLKRNPVPKEFLN
ncbi:hypothetical protein [Dyadobacter sp. 50-39]|uniref:hypothetical protein n=1 Tax=Dyadobacter sp. 50-39 TaxID=1895756 RepID=UPI000A5F0152|nr:hypothetical protein [Dyadobacter sp. 50-39]